MTVHIVKDLLGSFATYDDETDVLFATDKDYPTPTHWRPVPRQPGLEVGYTENEELVCVDRYCDEWRIEWVEHQCALRLSKARSHGHWGTEHTMMLTFGGGINLGLLNILRHGQDGMYKLVREGKLPDRRSLLTRFFARLTTKENT
jgi:hypothetical protein